MDLNLDVICQPFTFQMSRLDVYYFVFVNRTYEIKSFVLITMFVVIDGEMATCGVSSGGGLVVNWNEKINEDKT